MRSKLDRTIEKVGEFKNRINEVFSRCRHFHFTHAEYLKDYSEKIYDHPDYKTLPRWAESELAGFRDGMEWSFRAGLEGRWSLDGKQYSNGPEKDKAFANRYHDVTYDGLYHPGTDIKWY